MARLILRGIMARKRTAKFVRRMRTPTELEVETLTGKTLTVTFGVRKARADDLIESSPRHLPNATLFELHDEVAWALHSDFRRRGVDLPRYPWTKDASIEDWKPALRKWANMHNVPHGLILLRRSPGGYLMALLPVFRQQRMLKKDAERYRKTLYTTGVKQT